MSNGAANRTGDKGDGVTDGREEDVVRVAPAVQLEPGEEFGERVRDEGVIAEEGVEVIFDVCPVCLSVDAWDEGHDFEAIGLEGLRVEGPGEVNVVWLRSV